MTPKRPDIDVDLFEGWSDTQLVRETTTKFGAGGAGAAAELNRRMMNKFVEASRAAERLTRWVIYLTLVLIVLTGILVWDAFR